MVTASIKDGMDPGDGGSFQERYPGGSRESAERHLTLSGPSIKRKRHESVMSLVMGRGPKC